MKGVRSKSVFFHTNGLLARGLRLRRHIWRRRMILLRHIKIGIVKNVPRQTFFWEKWGGEHCDQGLLILPPSTPCSIYISIYRYIWPGGGCEHERGVVLCVGALFYTAERDPRWAHWFFPPSWSRRRQGVICSLPLNLLGGVGHEPLVAACVGKVTNNGRGGSPMSRFFRQR